MWQLIGKVINFIAAHRFSAEIAAIGTGGILIPDLANMEHAVKILAGMATVFVIVSKEIRDRRRKNENNKD